MSAVAYDAFARNTVVHFGFETWLAASYCWTHSKYVSTQTLQTDEACFTGHTCTVAGNEEIAKLATDFATVQARLDRAYEQLDQDVEALKQQMKALFLQLKLRMLPSHLEAPRVNVICNVLKLCLYTRAVESQYCAICTSMCHSARYLRAYDRAATDEVVKATAAKLTAAATPGVWDTRGNWRGEVLLIISYLRRSVFVHEARVPGSGVGDRFPKWIVCVVRFDGRVELVVLVLKGKVSL